MRKKSRGLQRKEGKKDGVRGEDLLTFNTPNTRDEKIIAFSRQMIKYLINTHVFFVSAQCPTHGRPVIRNCDDL